MNSNYDVLFTPMTIGSCQIKNRFVMCPMEGTTMIGWLHGKGYNPEIHDLFIDRAKDGIGLLIPGAVSLYSVQERQWLYQHPEAFEGISDLIDEVHTYGSKVFFQLSCGLGRNFPIASAMFDQYEKLNPVMHLDLLNASADENLPNRWVNDFKTQKLTAEEIHELIHALAETAYLCKENGADGIDVHAVHEGYLLDQFAMPYTNHRNDEYGGSLENRLRFACEAVQAIKKRCGQDYPVILRYSVTSRVRDFNKGIIPQDTESAEIGRTLEESIKAVKILEDAGYDGFNADNGTYDSWYYAHPPVYMPLNCNLKESLELKKHTSKPVICAGRMQLEESSKAISEGKLDFVGIARQFLTDEQYLTKIKEGRYEDVRPCISCHIGCLPLSLWKESGAAGDMTKPTGICALNPYTRHEAKYAVKPTANPKKFAVIGAGIAGMEFALQADKRGHQVDLYEKTDRFGGVFQEAASFSFKEKDRELLTFYQTQLKKSNVRLHLNQEIMNLEEISADEYVIATGAKEARKLTVPGAEYSESALDFLANGMNCKENAVIIGGGLTGCEIAYELALKHKKPVIIEMQDDILKAAGSCMANTSFLRDAFEYYQVPIYTSAKILEIAENHVVIETAEGTVKTIETDHVITSIGYIQGSHLGSGSNVHVIGDAEHVANLMNAIWEANDLIIKFQ